MIASAGKGVTRDRILALFGERRPSSQVPWPSGGDRCESVAGRGTQTTRQSTPAWPRGEVRVARSPAGAPRGMSLICETERNLVATQGCIFDRVIDGGVPAHLVLDEPAFLAFLDNRPVFDGHTLVVPARPLRHLGRDARTPPRPDAGSRAPGGRRAKGSPRGTRSFLCSKRGGQPERPPRPLARSPPAGRRRPEGFPLAAPSL